MERLHTVLINADDGGTWGKKKKPCIYPSGSLGRSLDVWFLRCRWMIDRAVEVYMCLGAGGKAVTPKRK